MAHGPGSKSRPVISADVGLSPGEGIPEIREGKSLKHLNEQQVRLPTGNGAQLVDRELILHEVERG
jgi:hypothetical protein